MNRFKNILYILQGEIEQQTAAIARVVTLARNNQADLTIVEVMSNNASEEMINNRKLHLHLLLQLYCNQQNIKIDILIITDFLDVIRAVLNHAYDLVVKPVENPDLMTKLFGSDDMCLLRKCPCPVWLIKQHEESTYHNILVALDFPTHNATEYEQHFNQKILELSASLALSEFSALHLAHAWDAIAEGKIQTWNANHATIAKYIDGERSSHEMQFHQLGEWLKNHLGKESYEYLAPHFHLRRGAATKVITDLAKELQADLIVIGTIGRAGISGLLIGNTAETILEQVNCSVLALKPAEFVSPVTLN